MDYNKYLSIDNGRGILFPGEFSWILEKYKINIKKYKNYEDLIRDIEILVEEDDEVIEELLIKLDEIYYYNYTNK